MSRMKLLLDVVSNLRSLADSLQAVADAAVQSGPERPGQNPEEQPVQEPEKKKAAKAPVPEAEPLTLEQVRAVLAEKSRAGHTAEVKALLLKHGADKLSEVDPAEYPALLADAEVL